MVFAGSVAARFFVFCFVFLIPLVLGTVLQPLSASGADGEGRFAIKGVGTLTCRKFVEVRTQNTSLHTAFLHWAEGFLTAVNRYDADTYDIAPWQTTAVLDRIFASHCEKNPDEKFVALLQKLGVSLRDGRLQERSEMLTITVNGESTRVYQALLVQAQAKLKELGFYGGAVDGAFGPKTQEAIATFQIAEGVVASGLPDPLTIWKLLSP